MNQTHHLPTGTLHLDIRRSELPVGDLFAVGARLNPKRAFLFVSKLLGKHHPCTPQQMAQAYARLAAKLPERAAALLARGAGYGYSRQVLGVHYPLDVIGGRMIAQYNVAHYLADSRYRQLFDEARDQLRTALTQACGMALAKCAADAGAQDPWDGSNARTFARYTLDYGLPAAHAGGYPVAVPKRAAMLAEPLLPQLSSAQRLERLSKVDSAAELGLDNAGQGQWQRLDLLGALPRP